MKNHEKFDAEQSLEEPYDRLWKLGRESLYKLFPDLTDKINSTEYARHIDGFVMDVLMHNGLPGQFFHRLDPSKQKAELAGKDIPAMFENLPEGLPEFYRKKFESPAIKKDPLDDTQEV